MSSLRSRLGKPLTPIIETVVDGEDTFVLSGLPSANMILNTADPKINEQLATLWNKTIAPVFNADSVQQIRMVTAYCQPPNGEPNYDASVLAEIFATDGALFLKLFGAAGKIAAGNKDNVPIENDAKN